MSRMIVAATIGGAAFALAGCGGSGSPTSYIRVVNVVPNGGYATFFINSGTGNGQQNFNQASSYLYIKPTLSTFSFSLSNEPSGFSIPSIQYNLNTNVSYSAILIGNVNVLSGATAPQDVILDDSHSAPSSGDAIVRFINAAPDAGTVNITLGSTVVASNLEYLHDVVLKAVTSGVVSSATPYNAPYANVASGSNTLTITGPSGFLYSEGVDFKSGKSYTVFLTEPIVISPTTPTASYGVYQVSDDR